MMLAGGGPADGSGSDGSIDADVDRSETIGDRGVDSPGDGGALCSLPTRGIPDGGARCSTSCDPARPDGGICYGVPSYNAATTSVQIWVEDLAAPQGGWRVTLAGAVPVTVGGHTYVDQLDSLVGTGGNGVFGDIFVARDGQAKWMGFHFEGYAAYQGNGVWDWPATVTVSNPTTLLPATFGRHYTITRAGPPCPPNNAGTYTFAADEPPRVCAVGWDIDLLAFTLPGA